MLLTLTISRKEIIQLNSVLSKRKRVLIWLFLDFNHQRSIIQSGKEVLFRLGNSSISSSALQIFLGKTMNILQSKGWSSGIPLRNQKDLQTLQGKAAPTKAFAHPGNEDTCSTEQML